MVFPNIEQVTKYLGLSFFVNTELLMMPDPQRCCEDAQPKAGTGPVLCHVAVRRDWGGLSKRRPHGRRATEMGRGPF